MKTSWLGGNTHTQMYSWNVPAGCFQCYSENHFCSSEKNFRLVGFILCLSILEKFWLNSYKKAKIRIGQENEKSFDLFIRACCHHSIWLPIHLPQCFFPLSWCWYSERKQQSCKINFKMFSTKLLEGKSWAKGWYLYLGNLISTLSLLPYCFAHALSSPPFLLFPV